MNEINCSDNWIDAYLEWTNLDGQAVGRGSRGSDRIAQGGADAGADFVEAYLEFMDAAQESRQSGPRRDAGAVVAYPGRADDLNEFDALREAALLAALRTESECVHILHCNLKAGDASPRTVTFAHEALQHAERLLNDERNAWRALTALRSGKSSHSGPVRHADSETDWPHALEDIATDVHALTAKVLELQPRRTGTSPR